MSMSRPWIFGGVLGLLVGGGVVIVSSLRYGFSAPLLAVGVVLAAVFGGLGLIAGLVREQTHVD